MAQKSVEQEMEVAVDVAALSSRAEKKWNELDVDDSFSASASAEWEKCHHTAHDHNHLVLSYV